MAKERGARSRQRRRGRRKKRREKEKVDKRGGESREGHKEWAIFCCVCGNTRRIRDFALSPGRVWLCFKPGLKHSRRCYRSCLLQTLHRQLMNDFLFHLNFDFSLFFCCWLCSVITHIWLIDKRKININNRDIIWYYCCTKKRQTVR